MNYGTKSLKPELLTWFSLALPLWAVDIMRLGAFGDDNMVMVMLMVIGGFMAWHCQIMTKFALIIGLYIGFIIIVHGLSFMAIFGQPQINDGLVKYVVFMVACNYFTQNRPKNMLGMAMVLGLVIGWQVISIYLPTFHPLKLTQYDDYLGFIAVAIIAIFPHFAVLAVGVWFILPVILPNKKLKLGKTMPKKLGEQLVCLVK